MAYRYATASYPGSGMPSATRPREREGNGMISDTDLCGLLKSDPENNGPIKELVSRHSGIYFKFIHKYLSSFSNLGLKDDLLQDASFHILEAAKVYDPTRKMKFCSFVGSRARFMCLNILNKQRKEPEIVSADSDEALQVPALAESTEHIDRKVIKKFMKSLDSYHDKRAKVLFQERYFSQDFLKPWREIAPKMNLSIQGCINIHDSALKLVSKEIRLKR